MPVVTARLAVAATLASLVVLALPGRLLWLVLVNVLLLVAAAVDWAATVDPRRLTVDRALPSTMRLDTEGTVVWKVRNPAGRQVTVQVADELVPSLRADDRRARLRVPAGGTGRARTTIRPSRRGRFAPAQITVRVHGRLGLAARQRRLPVPGRLVVLPAFPSRRRMESRITRARLAEAGERTARGRGGGTEFEGLRDYTVDDEFRRIDWAATARSRVPVVRTYRAEQNQTVIVMVDAGRTMAGRVSNVGAGQGTRGSSAATGDMPPGLGDVPRLDFAMDAAMALTMVATRLGDRAGLVVFDETVRALVPPRGRRDQVSLVSETLADVEPRLVEADYGGAFVATLQRFRRRALLVVLTELSPGSVEQTLIPALGLVARDHEVVVAGVADPDVARWATAEPTEAATAFRAAAAVDAMTQRRDLARRIRAAGAHVVDARPGELAATLADAYLRLKTSGRL